ncbi:MAG: class I SAM-dependent methyltransferase [Planctomycetia bacterium]|nr:class I SAM-dependent methyltransferase [Planctomycetia bacterium]
MSWFSDLRILYHMVFSGSRGDTHKDRLESFYSGQAKGYDDFRKRLLKGREELWNKMELRDGLIWVDIGGGTGANLENFGDDITRLGKVYVVDLSESLLKIADERIKAHGWTNVETVCADATTWVPPEKEVDVVSFSYSLTMIPDWFAAIDHAKSLLKSGGRVGVVDFYVSRKHPEEGRAKHGWATRTFWPAWFNRDNVYPTCDHVPYLTHHFDTVSLEECRGRIPWHPFFWWKMPYYIFVGTKK